MSSNFEEVVKKVIAENNMENLSKSVGWKRVREIRRELESKSSEMTLEKAVDEFLDLRPSYRDQKNDRSFKKNMAKMIH